MGQGRCGKVWHKRQGQLCVCRLLVSRPPRARARARAAKGERGPTTSLAVASQPLVLALVCHNQLETADIWRVRCSSWGARFVCKQLSPAGICKVGAVAHPSFLKESDVFGVDGESSNPNPHNSGNHTTQDGLPLRLWAPEQLTCGSAPFPRGAQHRQALCACGAEQDSRDPHRGGQTIQLAGLCHRGPRFRGKHVPEIPQPDAPSPCFDDDSQPAL